MTTPHVLDQAGDDERLDQGEGAWRLSPDRYLEENPPGYDGWQRSSCYVAVRDGTRIAVDVHLPVAGEADERFPAIVLFTPYYRRFALRDGHRAEVEPSPGAAQFREAFVPHGYAVVAVDVRGTGASFGWRDGFRSPKERDDYYDVAGWIVAQPWSDGVIGATGISYVGAAADFLASTGHPAVKAIIPTFSVWDTWSNHIWPGGVLLTVVPETYGKHCRAMDLDDREHVQKYAYFADPDFAGPAPVDEDQDGALLAEAIAEHGRNVDMVDFADELEFRDSALARDPTYTSATISPYHYAERANDMATACMSVTGWMDGGGYSTGAIQRFGWQRNPVKRLLIGPWDHGARAHVSPWRRTKMLRFALLAEYLRFFDTHLKGLETGLGDEKPVHYFTMGEEAWRAADSWPPSGTEARDFYFDEAARLTTEPPRHGEGVDHYLAGFDAGSGRQSRYERLYLVVVEDYYPDWSGRDEKMLVFTGRPLEADTEVTGQPVATLHLESSEPDCALFVYLEDLAPDGSCRYVTEGVFRALHRRSGRSPATIPPTGPQHSFLAGDAAPLVPGEVATVAFELLATSYLFRKGHRVRVAIALADGDHFRPISKARPPRLTIHRGPSHPSRLTLPIMRRGSGGG